MVTVPSGSSPLTLRWREADLNFQFPAMVKLCQTSILFALSPEGADVALSVPLNSGTTSSNPVPSSGESCELSVTERQTISIQSDTRHRGHMTSVHRLLGRRPLLETREANRLAAMLREEGASDLAFTAAPIWCQQRASR